MPPAALPPEPATGATALLVDRTGIAKSCSLLANVHATISMAAPGALLAPDTAAQYPPCWT
jgi:hypothetical protein